MSLGKLILKKNKAVSPVIATILLIALTVTAAAIVYFVVVPILTFKPELVTLDYGKVAGTTDRYEIEISNTGGAEATIDGLTAITLTNTTAELALNPTAVYVGAVLQVWPYVLLQGNSVTFVLDFDTALTTGVNYALTITYDQGKTLDITFTY
ncbi:MAG TPA: archaellin/type IV pilin N-terminal domain-containing protein [Candidatus Bathyarchaeia archaeon]|nr:archaellin/type IV pilin N-terminal domain-containing protein [Candidatus Bathyarchaeia archaeon]